MSNEKATAKGYMELLCLYTAQRSAKLGAIYHWVVKFLQKPASASDPHLDDLEKHIETLANAKR